MAISGAGEPPRAMLDLVLDQIDGAVSAGLYVAAMMAAITVPDICAALRSPDGETKPDRYEDWYHTYMGKHYGASLSADTCYKLRCRLLHQGTQQGLVGGPTRLFFLARPGPLVMGTSRMNDTLMIGVPTFCARVREAAKEWVEGNDPQVITNSQKLIREHPDGFRPFIRGYPVVG